MAPFFQAAAPSARPQIKITDIKTFLVGVGNRNLVFVKIETDQGIHGIGEAYSAGPDEATVATIADYKRWLVGHDPRNIEHLWSMMYNFTRFPGGLVVNSAISGIEHALWDIAGKAAGLPVYMLTGGKVRDRVRLYQSAGGNEPAQVGDNAKALVQKYGYTAVKMSPHPRAGQTLPYNQVTRSAGQRVRAVRDALGPDVDIGVDIHAKFFEVSRAARLAREIEPYNPMWLEEPIPAENVEAYKLITESTSTPIAAGENHYLAHGFRRLLEIGGCDIVMPDLQKAGGLGEGQRIANLANLYYTPFAPHMVATFLGAMAACHVCASVPNFLILEWQSYFHTDPMFKEIVKYDGEWVKNSFITLSEKPGIGVEINEEGMKKYAIPGIPFFE